MICISLPPQFLGVEGMSQPHGSSKRGKKKKRRKKKEQGSAKDKGLVYGRQHVVVPLGGEDARCF